MSKIRSTFKQKSKALSLGLELDLPLVESLCLSYQSKLDRALKEEGKFDFASTLRDRRTTQEYLYDLFDGWLVEDLLALKLSQELKSFNPQYSLLMQGCEMGLDGRNILLSNKMVTSKSDIEVSLNNQRVKIEIQFANQDRASYDIKETKMRQLRKEEAFILVYSLDKKQGFILDSLKDRTFGKMLPNPRWGGKMSYNFSKQIIENHIGFYDLKGLAKKINQIFGGSLG